MSNILTFGSNSLLAPSKKQIKYLGVLYNTNYFFVNILIFIAFFLAAHPAYALRSETKNFNFSSYGFQLLYPKAEEGEWIADRKGCQIYRRRRFGSTIFDWTGKCNAQRRAEGTGEIVVYTIREKVASEYARLPILGSNGLILHDGKMVITNALNRVSFTATSCHRSIQKIVAHVPPDIPLYHKRIVNELLRRATGYLFSACLPTIRHHRGIRINSTIELSWVGKPLRVRYTDNPSDKKPLLYLKKDIDFTPGATRSFWHSAQARFVRMSKARTRQRLEEEASARFWRNVKVGFFVLLGLLCLPLIPRLIRVLHYLFVPHPAALPIKRATTTADAPLDATALAKSLRTPPAPALQPRFVSENMRRKAEKLLARTTAQRKRYQEETRLAGEAVEMERERQHRNDKRTR